MYTLIGSGPSPYVRRTRILLEELKLGYDFQKIDVMSKDGQNVLAKYGPIRRVPVLIENSSQKIIRDSAIIDQYLKSHTTLDLEKEDEKNLLNEVCSSALLVLQLQRFKLDTDKSNPLTQNQWKRIGDILNYFDQKKLVQDEFDVISQWLFCTLDWFEYRELYPWRDERAHLISFYEQFKERDSVIKTDPRT